MKTFLQHLMEAPMTTGADSAAGKETVKAVKGARIPTERSGDPDPQAAPRGEEDLYNNPSPDKIDGDRPPSNEPYSPFKWPKWEYEKGPDGKWNQKPIYYAFG